MKATRGDGVSHVADGREAHGQTFGVPVPRDVVIAAATAVLDVVLWSDLLVSAGRRLESSSPASIVTLALVGFVILTWRHVYPQAVFALLCVHSVAGSILLTYRPINLVCVALATVSARVDRRTALGAYVCGVLTSGSWIVNEVRTSPEVTRPSVAVFIGLGYAVVLAMASGAGRWQFTSKQRVRDLERQRLEEAERAVKEERLRVARELHDIVAHTVTVMVLQAAGARRVLRTDQARAELALTEVEQAGTQAMDELRRLLGVLRARDTDGDTGHPLEVALERGLGGLPDLVDTVRRTGLRVAVDVTGDPGRLDPSVDLAAYRVLQEGLTNVSKHVGVNAQAAVRIEWRDGFLTVTVDDDGTRSKQHQSQGLSTGHGLVGLRERVELVGGRLDSGPGPSGGFRLTAVLPRARPAPASSGVAEHSDGHGTER